MPEPLRALILEDTATDLELIVYELGKAGFDLECRHVDNERDFVSALDPCLDVILADFALPQFDALHALRLLKEKGLSVPFIVVTGSISEEAAVSCMKEGATDYLLKDRLARLGPAIRQALEARKLQDEKLRAEEQIRFRNTELTLLNRIIAASADSTDERAFLQIACRELTLALNAFQTAAFLFNEQRTELRAMAEYRAEDDALSLLEEPYPLSESSMIAILSGLKAPLIVDRLTRDPRLPSLHQVFSARPISSLALIPLSVAGETVGGLVLAISEASHFTEDKAELVGSVAGHLSSAVTRTRLERDRRRLSTTIEQSADSIIITDTEGLIQYVNPGFERMTGYGRAEVIGKDASFLSSGRQDSQFYREMWETLIGGREWRGRFENRRKDGAPYTVDASITPVRDGGGTVVNFVDVQRDITNELQLESRYLQAQKMEAIGRLAGGVAHDFNNLLTAIMGYSELLASDIPPESPSRAEIDEIKKAADRAAGLTRQLLAFSRKQVLQAQLLDVNAIVTDIEKMLRHLIGEDISLKVLLDPRACLVTADPGQIQQVIMNLVVNARDAMPGGGDLVISTENVDVNEGYARGQPGAQPGSFVMLAVRDTGMGMSEEVQGHLFEPFYTTKEEGKGTGLGLATVYGIVKQSGGHISVESDPGKGTTVRVLLPRLDQETPSALEKPDLDTIPRGTERIALVEDNEIVRKLANRILTHLGYSVVPCGSAEEALSLIPSSQTPVDLLITDVVLPMMGGRDLADRLTSMFPRVKVLFISGYSEQGAPGGMASAEGTAYLQKPFTPKMLARTVRKVLEG